MNQKEKEELVKRGIHIQTIVTKLRQWFIKNPYPIELRKVAYTYGAGAKKFGGINQILSELEAEGIIKINMIETAHGIIQTVMLTEFETDEMREIS